jgi:hypothetical protein
MGKVIRSTYPLDFSIGLLMLIFAMACLLSHQIFDVPLHEMNESEGIYFGMFLASVPVVIMVIIVWEEILFPVRVKEIDDELIFRNHRTKLRLQILIYCCIPAILVFIYLEYEVNHVRFFIWSAVCMVPPIVEKIISGVNNYNDFLRFTDSEIEYKNNEKIGVFDIKNIQKITIKRDDRKIIEKIELLFYTGNPVTIDLDEMELDEFYDSIESSLSEKYARLM